LPAGKIVDPTDVEHLFPAVEGRGLAGGALWYDACVPDSQSMIMSVLRSTCQLGADALNYMPVVSMIKDRHRITGVRARDEIEGREYAFSSPRVINTTGPWVRDIARLFDRDLPSLFQYSIGWNILFDRESLSTHALAVSPPAPGSRLYFFHPWKGRLLVGTGHAPRESREENPHPTEEEIRQFLDDLNAAVPRMNLGRDDILHVFAGLIPVDQPGTLQFTKQDRIVEHARHGGPEGLFSMAGTKLTTGRSGAAAMIQHVFPNRPVSLSAEQALLNPESFEYALAPEQAALDYRWMPDENEPGWKNALQRIIQKEAVLHLDDLVLRRTTLGDNPVRALTLAPSLSMLFDWDADRRQVEIRRLEHHFQWIPNPATT
jgi:glycerol-3-phosphate dehydrogenase